MDYDRLSFYRSGLRKQWRWRYQAAGNNAKLANGGESYGKLDDVIASAFRACGLVGTTVEVSKSVIVIRPDGVEIFVKFPEIYAS